MLHFMCSNFNNSIIPELLLIYTQPKRSNCSCSSLGTSGKDGKDGVSPTVSVGTTSTVDSDSPASVTSSGTEQDQVLDFEIPKGKDGADGVDGKDGQAGTNGIDGKDGVSPTITIGTTTTVDSDSPATVTNSGTCSDLVLDFEIPKGKDGKDMCCLPKCLVCKSTESDFGSRTHIAFEIAEYTKPSDYYTINTNQIMFNAKYNGKYVQSEIVVQLKATVDDPTYQGIVFNATLIQYPNGLDERAYLVLPFQMFAEIQEDGKYYVTNSFIVDSGYRELDENCIYTIDVQAMVDCRIDKYTSTISIKPITMYD